LHVLGITWGITVATLLMIVTATAGYFLIQKGLLIDVSWTIISEFITGSIAFYLRFRQQYKLRQQIKKQFEHYLDPRQVKKLQDNPESLVLGGERRYCTFLFTDVRGFTAMSEKLEPEEVTEIMNKALTIQADTVKEYDGMVDKYIGDAMMAIFNAPIDVANHETMAVLCAQDIQRKFKKANLGVEIGVGINTGYAVVGNMGSDKRFDYSAIGDAVNLAARLESSTKEVGEDIVIGYDTISSSTFSDQIILKELESIFVKGKEKPIKIYTLQDDR
jgi:adenylate cyclase